ncbi:MAG TPA: hypothetical protein VLB47_14475 [Solirubrobacteraceae bacterium]|nr:hypothetical protein [Solirubrobacteraceae bacterium]
MHAAQIGPQNPEWVAPTLASRATPLAGAVGDAAAATLVPDLRPAPPAPPGNQRRTVHGGRSEVLPAR